MSRDSAGNYTLPSAVNPVVGGTAITANWGNTTMNDLASAMTDSLDRNGRGGMLQPLKVANGAVGAPSYSYTNEATSGFYRNGAGDIRFARLGVDSPVAALTLLAASIAAFLTSLGLGTGDSPTFTGQNGGPLAGLRNRVINGDMRIDQRNVGGAVTPTGSAFSVDRWQMGLSQASKLSWQQVADAPPGLKYSIKHTVVSQFAPGAADEFWTVHKVEGHNIVDFQLGVATAKQVTLTVWVKGSIAGTYSCFFQNSAQNRSYVGTITVAAGWVKQPVTLTLDVTGTWLTDTGIGMIFGIDLGSGTNFNLAAGAWSATKSYRTAGSVTFVNQVNGSTLNIAGVQLETGSVGTSFEQRPIGMELELCQRYYEKSFPFATAPAQNAGNTGAHFFTQVVGAVTSQVYSSVEFKVQKRAAPGVLTVYNPGAANAQVRNISVPADCSGTGVSAYEGHFIVSVTTAAGSAAGQANGLHWSADAEL